MLIHRFEASRPFLQGHGIEIGAGPNPQTVSDGVKVTYFDIRSTEELNAYFGENVTQSCHSIERIGEFFPEGADFLIAHHVLEHLADPIGGLRQWMKFVRPDGVFVLSLPDQALCADRARLTPDLNHLLLDHLLDRGPDAFESREHVLSFLCSWIDDSPGLAGLTASQACGVICKETHRSGHDFHWHAFTPELVYELIHSAAALEQRQIDLLVDPRATDRSSLDVIAVFSARYSAAASHSNPVSGTLNDLRQRLLGAVSILELNSNS
jgi:SAM-dependent methyltransferase